MTDEWRVSVTDSETSEFVAPTVRVLNLTLEVEDSSDYEQRELVVRLNDIEIYRQQAYLNYDYGDASGSQRGQRFRRADQQLGAAEILFANRLREVLNGKDS